MVGVGIGSFDGFLKSDDSEVATVAPASTQVDPAIAALAAVTAAVETASAVEVPAVETTSEQLAALLTAPVVETAVQVAPEPVVDDV